MIELIDIRGGFVNDPALKITVNGCVKYILWVSDVDSFLFITVCDGY